LLTSVNFEIAELYLSNLQKHKIEYKNELAKEIESYNNILNNIRSKYVNLENTFKENNFIPSFQWAQNRNYIVLEVILSDGTSKCKEVENEFIDLYASGLEMSGQCVEDGVLNKFKLKLNFHDDIVRLNSMYHLENGKYIFMLKKKTFFKWASLTKENFGPIWKEMQERYDEEEKKLKADSDNDDDDLDDDEDEEVAGENKRKKKRRPSYELGSGKKKRSYEQASYWS
jgi:hypothetical protein